MRYLLILGMIVAAFIWIPQMRTVGGDMMERFAVREKFHTIQTAVQARLTGFFRDQLHTAVDGLLKKDE